MCPQYIANFVFCCCHLDPVVAVVVSVVVDSALSLLESGFLSLSSFESLASSPSLPSNSSTVSKYMIFLINNKTIC